MFFGGFFELKPFLVKIIESCDSGMLFTKTVLNLQHREMLI